MKSKEGTNEQVRSSFAKAPKLQLAAEQPSTGKCCYHQKMIPHIQGQRKSFKKAVEGAQSHLKSNLIPARDTQRA